MRESESVQGEEREGGGGGERVVGCVGEIEVIDQFNEKVLVEFMSKPELFFVLNVLEPSNTH